LLNKQSKICIKICLLLATYSLSICTQANDKIIYQNWAIDSGLETVEAYTANDSSSSFGLFCGGSTCTFYLHTNIGCQPNAKNSVLLNSASISTAINMQCTLIRNNYFEILEPFDVVMNAVNSGEYIGFAVALQGGAFAVARFSLIGAKTAIGQALNLAASKKSKPSPPQPNLQNSRQINL